MQQTNMLPKAAYNFRTDTKDLNERVHIQGYVDLIAELLNFVTREALWPQVPKH